MDPLPLLADLVAFDTTSSRSNLPLIDFVSGYLDKHGIASRTVPDATGEKASLLATIGPAADGGVVLSGHTDVVPVTDQPWTADPFSLTRRDDRLLGRGTADMKGFIACVLAMAPMLNARTLRVPVHLAFSYDEEVGCLAAPALIEALLADGRRPAFAIVGEPSEMRVCNRHRGIHTYRTTVTGRPGHAGAPARGANAIAAAAECVTLLTRLGEGALADDPDVPEVTSVNVGRIEGGTAVNIIAGRCHFAWECRPGPDDAAARVRDVLEAHARDVLLPAIRARAPDAHLETEEIVAVPPLRIDEGAFVQVLAMEFAGQQRPPAAVPFASEAGLFQAAGVPAVVVGPGSPAQAHQPDEFVTIAQLDACMEFLGRLADWATEN